MNRLIRLYNQNRKRFWLIVFVAIIVVVTPRMLNEYIKNNKKNTNSSNTNVIGSYNKINNKPYISGDTISEETTKKSANVINEFFNYCNDKNIEAAYNMISNDCKEQLFPKIEDFENRYYNKIFSEKRLHSIETWISTDNSITYKVNITEDMLSTGKSAELNVVDYYTIVNEDNTEKLNINNYIGKEIVDAENSVNNINFKAIERYLYVDYEIYKISVYNKTNNRIMVDSKQITRSVYVQDQKDQKYMAFLNEIGNLDLALYSGQTKEIKIKFNKAYNPKYIDKNLVFSDIVIDVSKSAERANIKIEI